MLYPYVIALYLCCTSSSAGDGSTSTEVAARNQRVTATSEGKLEEQKDTNRTLIIAVEIS